MQFVYGLLPINVRKCCGVCVCVCVSVSSLCAIVKSGLQQVPRICILDGVEVNATTIRHGAWDLGSVLTGIWILSARRGVYVWCCGYAHNARRLDSCWRRDRRRRWLGCLCKSRKSLSSHRVWNYLCPRLCVTFNEWPHTHTQKTPNGLHIFDSVFKQIRIKTRCDEFHMVRPHYTEEWTLTCIVLRCTYLQVL